MRGCEERWYKNNVYYISCRYECLFEMASRECTANDGIILHLCHWNENKKRSSYWHEWSGRYYVNRNTSLRHFYEYALSSLDIARSSREIRVGHPGLVYGVHLLTYKLSNANELVQVDARLHPLAV